MGNPVTMLTSSEQRVEVVRLLGATAAWEQPFLAAVLRSRHLHHPWVYPPEDASAYRRYLANIASGSTAAYLVCVGNGELAGVININNIVMGALRSGALGYYAFEPWAGCGAMTAGLRLVMKRAFTHHGLHRLEANIQPHNERSKALVVKQAFRFEGLARRLLKVGTRWRDHERWALTVEEWRTGRSLATAELQQGANGTASDTVGER